MAKEKDGSGGTKTTTTKKKVHKTVEKSDKAAEPAPAAAAAAAAEATPAPADQVAVEGGEQAMLDVKVESTEKDEKMEQFAADLQAHVRSYLQLVNRVESQTQSAQGTVGGAEERS
ncbi:unnamed protein product [Anisakis simplex]|uniref:EKC/KEOPS complex subunit GON7 n=1 Tax=Anisakis simplex TaxID=6269 RepID=A0A0M3J8M6_ANISI|nr:unnamed protein product [Anisakis simplex]